MPAQPRQGHLASIDPDLRRDLHKQDCASPASFTWPVTRQVDPFHVIRSVASARSAAGSGGLARMLEWAYGYRGGRGAGRRAPSAGALYPCELFTVELTLNRWRCYLYDFTRRLRIELARADAVTLARTLRLGEGQAGVVVVAALWRTVQRYGARGYRYCALDAGHVLGNLSRVASTVGGRACWHAPPDALVSSLLDLPDSTAALAAGVVDIGTTDMPSPPGVSWRSPDSKLLEETPLVSPQLLRARRFHDKAQACSTAPVQSPPAAAGALFSALETRQSAKDFLSAEPESMPSVALEAVREFLSQPSMRGAGTIIPIAGADISGDSVAGLSRAELCRVCQHQELLSRADAAFLFTAPRPGRRGCAVDHGEFLRSCLYSGMVSSELYRLAGSLGLASTMIGGFFDSELLPVCAPGGYPLALHVFGQPVSGLARKVDAALVAVSGG